MAKKNFEGIGLPEAKQSPTEFFLGENNKKKIFINPIAIYKESETAEPTAILSENDFDFLSEQGAIFDQETFLKQYGKGAYSNLKVLHTNKELKDFYDSLFIHEEQEQEEEANIKKAISENIVYGSYTLKAPKDLLEILKVMSMIKKTSIKDLFIDALNEYCQNNKEDFEQAKVFIETILKK